MNLNLQFPDLGKDLRLTKAIQRSGASSLTGIRARTQQAICQIKKKPKHSTRC